jgi:hypothetical protein
MRLKIAELIIEIRSHFDLLTTSNQARWIHSVSKYKNFIYEGNKRTDITIEIKLTEKLPVIRNTTPLFTNYNIFDGQENWSLSKNGSRYIYQGLIEKSEHVMIVCKDFSSIEAYLVSDIMKPKGRNLEAIYDFMQILLMGYLAQRKYGFFVHSCGIKDIDGKGIVFAGKSGAGKSTTARLWYAHSKAKVLNDDRIIVLKKKDNYFIYTSPWHGDFYSYFREKMDPAPLCALFFIYHSQNNKVKRLTENEAFKIFYTTIFPTFWDKNWLENTAKLATDMLEKTPSFKLGFIKDKSIINYVRGVRKEENA